MSRYIDVDAFEAFGYTTQDGNFDDGVQFVLEKIDEQPTADVVEVVHGEWLKDAEDEIYCSECGKYTYDRHDEIKEFDGKTVFALCYPRFCGNCGADMRGGNDGN